MIIIIVKTPIPPPLFLISSSMQGAGVTLNPAHMAMNTFSGSSVPYDG